MTIGGPSTATHTMSARNTLSAQIPAFRMVLLNGLEATVVRRSMAANERAVVQGDTTLLAGDGLIPGLQYAVDPRFVYGVTLTPIDPGQIGIISLVDGVIQVELSAHMIAGATVDIGTEGVGDVGTIDAVAILVGDSWEENPSQRDFINATTAKIKIYAKLQFIEDSVDGIGPASIGTGTGTDPECPPAVSVVGKSVQQMFGGKK